MHPIERARKARTFVQRLLQDLRVSVCVREWRTVAIASCGGLESLNVNGPPEQRSATAPAMHKMIGSQSLWLIVIVAFVTRAAVRWHFGEVDFLVSGYIFFFDLAQNIAAGKG